MIPEVRFMKLGIYTIEKTLYEGKVKELVAKSSTGEITVLPGHIPLVTRLLAAPLKVVEEGGEEKSIAINSGFLEIQPDGEVVILVDTP
jgi:F-type H+-transporting ATPase subunit epsilon